MRNIGKVVVALLTFLLLPSLGAAQEGATISGVVTSEAGVPVEAATVFIDGLNVGTTTTGGGRYTLALPAARLSGQAVTLRVRRIGFTSTSSTITLTPGSQTRNFILGSNPMQLGEVVVTGEGTRTTREKLGNVINSVDSVSITRSNEPNIVQALAGKAPNVEVNQQSGEPGASSYIRIRGAKSISGTGQPLFVVDGVPIDNTTFATGPATAGTVTPNRASDINPADIASVDILKGPAAAAIYGARAAQGVVLITTKGGKSGETRYSLRSNFGWNTVNKEIPLQTKYGQGIRTLAGTVDNCLILDTKNCTTTGFSWGPELTQPIYTEAIRARLTALGRNPADAEATFARLYPNGLQIQDHFGELFDTGFDSDMTLTSSGGNDKTTFYMSVGRLSQRGIIVGPNNWYQRTSGRLKATHRLLDRLTIGGNANYIDTRGSFIQKGSNLSGLLLGAMRTPPNYDSRVYLDPVSGLHRSYRFPNPSIAGIAQSRIYDNPFFVANKVPNKSELGRVIANVNVDYDPMDWLAVRYNLGGDYYSDWRLEALPLGSGSYGPGSVTRADFINTILNSNLSAIATKNFSENLATTFTLGQTLGSRRYRQNYTRGFDLVAPEPYAVQNTTTWEPSEFRSLIHTESYYGQLNLDLFRQVFVTAAVRNDGFSTFGQAKQRFWFPKASVAWAASNIFNPEQSGPLSFVKLRAAYGEAGKEPGVYETIPTTLTVGGSFGGGWGDYLNATQSGLGGLYTSRALGNNETAPERTKETEMGADIGLLDQKIDLGLTFYNAKSVDVIISAPTPPSTGFTSRLFNAAVIRNKGVEATFNARPITTANFAWDFGINYAKNKNRVLDLKGAEFVDKSAGTFSGVYGSVTKGSEVGVIRGEDFVRCGRGLTVGTTDIDNTAGHCQGAPNGALYIDTDGYPVYDETDRIIANPNPRWTGSFRSSMSFRKVTLSALVDRKGGGDVWNGTKGALFFFGTHKDTEVRDVNRVFGTDYMPTRPGVSGVVAGPGVGVAVPIGFGWSAQNIGSGFTGPSAQFIEDGSYTKLREVSVSMNFDQPFVRRIFGFSSMDLRLAGRNLKTWTNYTGIDPETNLGGAEVFVQGIDYFNNPQTRSFVVSVGLNR